RSARLGTAYRQLRDRGRAYVDSRRRFLRGAGCLLAGPVWYSHRDQRLSERVGSRGDAAAAAAGAAAGLSGNGRSFATRACPQKRILRCAARSARSAQDDTPLGALIKEVERKRSKW